MLLETRSGRHQQMPVRTALEAEDRCQAVTWGLANYVITSFPLAGLLSPFYPPLPPSPRPRPVHRRNYQIFAVKMLTRLPRGDTSFSDTPRPAARRSMDSWIDNLILRKTIQRRRFLLVSVKMALCSSLLRADFRKRNGPRFSPEWRQRRPAEGNVGRFYICLPRVICFYVGTR